MQVALQKGQHHVRVSGGLLAAVYLADIRFRESKRERLTGGDRCMRCQQV